MSGVIVVGRYRNFIPAIHSKNLEYLKLPECIYITENYKCSVLRVDSCSGEKCHFYKTASEKNQSCERWEKRMNSISQDEQEKIAKSYYIGNMPWKH